MTHHCWNLIGAGVQYQQINQYYFIDTGFAPCTESNTQDTCVPCSEGFYLIGKYETSNFADPNVCAAIKECSPGKYHTITDFCRGECEFVLSCIIFPEDNARGEYDTRGWINFHISWTRMVSMFYYTKWNQESTHR
jgi:hypothetical protein